MQACPFDFVRDAQRHVICLVGGGGKTTVMYELAAVFALQGRRVLVCTSTHIWQPASAVYAASVQQVRNLWYKKSYAVIGTQEPQTGKLTAPQAELYTAASKESELILCEADGAKGLPCKLPAAHEPVLLPDCDIVLAVAGMDALGHTLSEACFRPLLAQQALVRQAYDVIDEQLLAQLLLSQQGARKAVGERAYYVVLNKCDAVPAARVQQLQQQLVAAGLASSKIWLRGEVERC